MRKAPKRNEVCAVIAAGILFLLLGPYLIVKVWHSYEPQLFGELFYVQLGSGERALIGESRLPTNWIHQTMGWEFTSVLNQMFFRFQGEIDLMVTGRKVFL